MPTTSHGVFEFELQLQTDASTNEEVYAIVDEKITVQIHKLKMQTTGPIEK